MQSNTIFNGQYVVSKKISSGSFGVVLLGHDNQNNIDVAIKIEKEENEEVRSLEREVQILKQLSDTEGVPKMYWQGQQDDYNVIVMQILGKDLAYYLKSRRKFSPKTAIQLGIEILKVLERIHKKGVVHRDLKPENILLGLEEDTKIYVVDFGISKIFRDKNGKIIPFRDGASFIGTTRYASIAAHRGHELSRKDDLESLIYVLLYFIKGQLPWQNMQNVTDEQRTAKVGEMKAKIDSRELCQDAPIGFSIILEYLKTLQYRSEPDYAYINKLFLKSAENLGIQLDSFYDWYMTSQRKLTAHEMTKQQSQEMKISLTYNQSLQPPLQTDMKKSLEKQTSNNFMRMSSNNNFLTPPSNNQLQPPLLRRQDSQQPSVVSGQGSVQLSTYNSIKPKYQQSQMAFDQFDQVKQSMESAPKIVEKVHKEKLHTDESVVNQKLKDSLQKPQIKDISQSHARTETIGWQDSVFEENYQDDPLFKKYGQLKVQGVEIGKKNFRPKKSHLVPQKKNY